MRMNRTEQLRLLAENCEAIIPKGGLEEKLAHGRPLVVKLGLDPTAPDIHLGHTVVLRKLRQFQDLGHTVILIVGDFTARIGDPSGKSHMRPSLSVAEIKKNAATYKKQAVKILDPKKLTIRFNSEWLEKLKVNDILKLMSHATVAQMLTRDDFRKRYEGGQQISLHELLYPLLQAQDSVAIKADVELGGTDQTFNLLMGRELQKALGKDPQVVMTMPLLVGLDGRQKMSKSLGNYIGITESAENIFGKIMSLPDTLILPYMRLVSDMPAKSIPKREEDIRGGEMALKQSIARSIAARYTSTKRAEKAQEHFRLTFQRREFPKDAPSLYVPKPTPLLDVLAMHKLFLSKSEARRKIAEGAVRLDRKKVADPMMVIDLGAGEIRELQIGKLGFYHLTRQKK